MHGHEYFFGVLNPKGWWISEKFDGVRALWNKSNFVSKTGMGRVREEEDGGGRTW